MSTNDNILEPPGTIAILGGGPLAIELSLYARYLGFSTTLLSTTEIVPQLRRQPEAEAPRLFATPLGIAALASQRGLGGTMIDLEVSNHGQWLENYFLPLIEADLLNGRVHSMVQLLSIKLAEPEAEPEPAADKPELDESASAGEDDEPLPPDFAISWIDSDGQQQEQLFEAIVDTRLAKATDLSEHPGLREDSSSNASLSSLPEFYLLVSELISENPTDSEMAACFERIRRTFADLCDRETLDVYKNLGGFA